MFVYRLNDVLEVYQSPALHYELGKCFEKVKRFKEAIQQYEISLRQVSPSLFPSFPSLPISLPLSFLPFFLFISFSLSLSPSLSLSLSPSPLSWYKSICVCMCVLASFVFECVFEALSLLKDYFLSSHMLLFFSL